MRSRSSSIGEQKVESKSRRLSLPGTSSIIPLEVYKKSYKSVTPRGSRSEEQDIAPISLALDIEDIPSEEIMDKLTDEDFRNIFAEAKLISECEKSKQVDVQGCGKTLSGSQGSLYYDCTSPAAKGKAIKLTSAHKYGMMHNWSKERGSLHDLKNFANQCTIHKKLQLLAAKFPNLVNIYDCWYCLSETNPDRSNVYIMQEYLRNAIPLEKYLYASGVAPRVVDIPPGPHDASGGVLSTFDPDRKSADVLQAFPKSLSTFGKSGKSFVRNITSIIIQVVGTMEALREQGLYHNDLHIGNIFLLPWIEEKTMQYKIGGKDFYLNNTNSDWFVKIIDFGLMTESYPLDTRYLPTTKTLTTPWTDICQFLLGFQELSYVIPDFNSLLLFCQRSTHRTARELAIPLRYEYQEFADALYNLYRRYLVE